MEGFLLDLTMFLLVVFFFYVFFCHDSGKIKPFHALPWHISFYLSLVISASGDTDPNNRSCDDDQNGRREGGTGGKVSVNTRGGRKPFFKKVD